MAAISQPRPSVIVSPYFARQLRKFTAIALVTLFGSLLAFVYLLPFGNMMTVALRDQESLAGGPDSPILPMKQLFYEYNDGQRVQRLEVFNVPIDGETRQLAALTKRRTSVVFIDPNDPTAEPITWEGNWRALQPAYVFQARWENFPEAWQMIDFPLLFRNTFAIAFIGMIGTLLSSISVAYAFSRFPIPGKNWLFIVLIGTIILPGQVTLIPTYAFFASIGWTGTWLPLIVPHFFANAYNVFLLRQFFMTLPRELDEAAMIDGASPFQILLHVIVPQSWAAIITVGLFHFVWAWNDYFGPLIYLLGKPELQPISVGVQIFNFRYAPRPELVQATSLMAMLLPVILFILAQRFFMRGVVITGVEK
jgi:multiple sugar transport system permease protein